MNGKYWGEIKPKTPKGAQNTDNDKNISVQENKIYYYAGVNRDSAVELNKKIAELESKSLSLSNSLDIDTQPIKHSFMLIHQLSTNFWGTYSRFEDEKENLDLMMKTIKDVYKKYTKVPMKRLDTILKHDLLWDANKCLEYGLVDEII